MRVDLLTLFASVQVDCAIVDAVAKDLSLRITKGEPEAWISDIVQHNDALKGLPEDEQEPILHKALQALGIAFCVKATTVALTHPTVRAKCGVSVKRNATRHDYKRLADAEDDDINMADDFDALYEEEGDDEDDDER